MSKDFVQFRIQTIQIEDSRPIYNRIEAILLNIVNEAKSNDIWNTSISSIIVTDALVYEVKNQAKVWRINTSVSKARNEVVLSKLLFNRDVEQPDYISFIDFRVFFSPEISLREILFSQVLQASFNDLLPRKILLETLSPNINVLINYIRDVAISWAKSCYTNRKLEQLIKESTEPKFNHQSILNSFKRRLKRSLYDYNTDKEDHGILLHNFWLSYSSNIHRLILRILENESIDEEKLINKEEECRNEVYNIIDEVHLITDKLLNEKKLRTDKLKSLIIKLSASFHIYLERESEKNFYIRMGMDPKNYFPDLVDTEPRLVCFLDILGFSEIVEEYEQDATSTFLQDLEESFTIARTYLFEQGSKDKDAFKHLEYQTFSDNICISIPFFEREDDFFINTRLLITFIRGFQAIMMSKGFFVRGGLAIGSYYADKSIIFSKGLIKAYHLESKKAIYPRVLIHKEIMDKIIKYGPEKATEYGLSKAIILDWEDQAFINPTSFIQDSIEQFENIVNELKSESDNSDEFEDVLNSLTQLYGEFIVELFKSKGIADANVNEEIKKHIQYNLRRYKDNQNIYSKYLWISELFKWMEGDENAKLAFRYFEDKL